MTIADIVNRIYFLTKTTADDFSSADMLISINNAYDRVASLIIKVDGRWQWDDTNQTDLPIATTALVSGQSDYSLATSHLEITRVELKDQGGNWSFLNPIDQNDVKIALNQFATSGTPIAYDKLGSSVFLYPIPNYSQDASLKLYFQRGPDKFDSSQVTAGTKQPGFSSLYHDLIPLWTAYDYWLVNDPSMTTRILNQITMLEDAIRDDYSSRSKDEQGIIRPIMRSSR